MRATFERIVRPADHSFHCFRRVEPFFPFEWHYHPELELTLIEASRGERIVGDHVSEYHPGDLVFLGSKLPHTWVSGGDCTSGDADAARAVVLQFEPDVAGASLFEAPEMRSVRSMLDASSRGLMFDARAQRDVARRLARLPDATGPSRLIGLLEVLAILASHAGRARPLASPTFIPVWSPAAQRRIEVVCRYIQENLAEPLSQSQLARRVGMNASAFGRFFKKAAGRTVVDYINDVRVGVACRLLIETERSILEISARSGFNNLSHFNRQFRRLRGSTPSEFREHFGVTPRAVLVASSGRGS